MIRLCLEIDFEALVRLNPGDPGLINCRCLAYILRNRGMQHATATLPRSRVEWTSSIQMADVPGFALYPDWLAFFPFITRFWSYNSCPCTPIPIRSGR